MRAGPPGSRWRADTCAGRSARTYRRCWPVHRPLAPTEVPRFLGGPPSNALSTAIFVADTNNTRLPSWTRSLIARVSTDVNYRYPIQATVADAISEGVLLEMGTRGGTFPTRRHQIRSLLADFAIDHFDDSTDTWAEFSPFAVEVLAPERTLFEKLSALHDGAARAPDAAAIASLQRNARHLYDIHCLLRDEQVVATLNALGTNGIALLCADIDNHSDAAGFSHTPRPADGFAASPLLTDGHPSRTALEQGYQRAMQLVYGAQPSLQDCLDSIHTHAHVL